MVCPVQAGAERVIATLIQPLAIEPTATLAVYLVESGDPLAEDLKFANERLVLASLREQALAEEAREATVLRDDVLAIVSHDLRNPLSAITMCTLGMIDESRTHESSVLRSGLELIHRSAMHMRSLVDELLDVASIHTSQLELSIAPVRVVELVQDAMEMLAPLAQKKGIELSAQVESPELIVLCDRDRTLRVLANLLSNAIKFSTDGGVRVSVERAGERVRVTVRDTGPGIPAAELENLFERYWKGPRSGRSGMGLGLYIARGIVEAQGGRISVETELGVGSAFSFVLPAG